MLPSFRNFLQSMVPHTRERPLPAPPPGCVVLIRTDMFGDHVIFGGFIEKLRQAWPKTRLVLVAPEVRRHLYETCPLLDEQIFFDWREASDSPRARADLFRRINRTRPDYIIHSQYTRSMIGDRIVRYCHAPVRLGVTGHNPQVGEKQRRKFDPYYTHLLRIPDFQPTRTETQICQALLERMGISGADYRPAVWTSPADVAFAEKTFLESGFAPGKTLILFSGSSSKLRAYPRLNELIVDLLQDGPWSVITVGGKADQANGEPPGESLRARWLNLCGLCTIRESAELMRRCRLVLGVETGLAQVAVAVGAPQVLLQGGAFFGRFLTSDALTSLVIEPLDCYFCQADCKYDQAYCLSEIPPRVFRRAVDDALKATERRGRIYFAETRPESFTGSSARPKFRWEDKWVDPAIEVVRVGREAQGGS
jgi:ADP-heptose:LPS heptosyltransferase